MKLLTLLFFLFCNLALKSQTTQKFYNYKWDSSTESNASYYSLIEKTDSGWKRSDFFIANNQLQMEGLYEDEECTVKNGFFSYYYYKGQVSSRQYYEHNKMQGLSLSYHQNGQLEDSTMYNQGQPIGISKGYFDNGHLRDSSFFNSGSEGTCFSWFPNGKRNSILHYFPYNKLNGTCKYFHTNGQLASQEEYDSGKLLLKKYFDDKGKSMDTLNHDRDAFPIQGFAHWQKYLDRAIGQSSKEKNNYSIPLIVLFLIDTDGHITNASISLPLRQSLDSIAMNIVKKYAELWSPIIDHNRKIPSLMSQPIFIKQR